MINYIRNIIIRLKSKKIKLEKNVRLKNVIFQSNNKIGKNTKVSYTSLGIGTYIGSNCNITKTKIGKYCSIGSEVKTIYGKHPTSKYVTTHPFAFNNTMEKIGFKFEPNNKFRDENCNKLKRIEIGNDVWIGNNVLILEGIKIGDGAIIGAGAVVVKDVPEYAIVVGVPAKIIKYRFSIEEIKFLKDFKWWDKDLEWIKENIDLFSNIKNFKRFLKNKEIKL